MIADTSKMAALRRSRRDISVNASLGVHLHCLHYTAVQHFPRCREKKAQGGVSVVLSCVIFGMHEIRLTPQISRLTFGPLPLVGLPPRTFSCCIAPSLPRDSIDDPKPHNSLPSRVEGTPLGTKGRRFCSTTLR